MTNQRTGIYGYEVLSDVPLARLRRGPMPRGRLRIKRSDEELLSEPAELIQLVEEPQSERIMFAIARSARSLLASCAQTGPYRVDAARGEISTTHLGRQEDLEERLLNAVVPLLLVESGELVIHGSAVLSDGGAVVFCGPSGRGKSTLCAALGSIGLPVLAEDSVAITVGEEGALLWPGPVGVRLDPVTAAALYGPRAGAPKSVRGKQMLVEDGADRAGQPVPVTAIICLEKRGGSEVRLSELREAAAVANVFLNVCRLEQERWRAQLERTAELVRRVRCYRARLPDDLKLLPEAALRLLGRVGEGGEAPGRVSATLTAAPAPPGRARRAPREIRSRPAGPARTRDPSP